MIAEYLERLLPDDWDKMDLPERRGFLRGDQFTGGNRVGTQKRTTVSAVEIWAECFGKDPSSIRKIDSYELGVVLRKLGWVSCETRKRIPLYGQQRMWECDKQK